MLLTALVALGPLSTDLYLPSLPAMTRQFSASVAEMQLTLSLFMVAFALAQLVYGPLSDRFGRRPVLLAGLLVYLLGSGLCLLADSMAALILGRVAQALGACAGPVLGRAMVRDVFPRDQAARVMSYMAAAMALAPAVAPLLGGVLQTVFGWQANFVALMVYGLGLVGLVVLYLGETNRHRNPLATRPTQIAANYLALLRDRNFTGHLAINAAAFGALFSFISGSSFVLIQVLGMAEDRFGLAFLGVVLGYIAGAVLSGRLGRRLGLDRMLMLGNLAAVAGGLLLAGLSWAGVAQVWAVVAPTSLLFLGVAMILPNATAAAIAPYPTMAGAASALLGCIQMGAGALAGWIVSLTYAGTSHAMTTVMAACTLLAALAYGVVRGRR